MYAQSGHGFPHHRLIVRKRHVDRNRNSKAISRRFQNDYFTVLLLLFCFLPTGREKVVVKCVRVYLRDAIRGIVDTTFYRLSIGIRQRTTCGPCSPNLMSWRTVTATMEQVVGIEPAFSPWRGEVLAVIRYLHRIAGEPSLSPAMMLVLEVVNPEHHLYTL